MTRRNLFLSTPPKMDLFRRTPLQQYELMKKNLQAKYSNEKVWGGYYSWNRVGALDDISEFVSKAESLATLDPELKGMIDEENTKLLVGKMIPLPKSLREEMEFSFITEFSSFEDTYLTLRERLDYRRKSLRSVVKDLSDASVAYSPTGIDTMAGDGKPRGLDQDDDVEFYEGEFPEEFFDSDNKAKSCISQALSEDIHTKEVLNDGNVYDDKDSFCAMLKWLRWRIYQKAELKIVSRLDVKK